MSPRAPILPTPADLAAWRQLAEAAKDVAARKPRSLDHMLRKAALSFKAVFPDQSGDTRAACIRLIGRAEDWPRMGAEDRQDAAPGLRDAAEAVLAILDGQAGGPEPQPAGKDPPPRRYRADIDG